MIFAVASDQPTIASPFFQGFWVGVAVTLVVVFVLGVVLLALATIRGK